MSIASMSRRLAGNTSARLLGKSSVLALSCCLLAHPAMAQSTTDDKGDEEAASASTAPSRQAGAETGVRAGAER